MLSFTRTAYDAVVAHARDGAPDEICGVLGGERGDDHRVRTVRRAENTAPNPRTEYRLDPAEQLELMDAIEGGGEDVVGFYHSHPAGPAVPSSTDEARATWPGRSYVVVALDGEFPYVGAWRWTGERFEQQAVALND